MGTQTIKTLKSILTHQIITMPMVIWLTVSFFESMPFIFSWNQFLFSLILSGPKTKTVPVAVYNFISYGKIDWAGIGAAATLIVLPVSVFAFFVRKSIVQGTDDGGTEGLRPQPVSKSATALSNMNNRGPTAPNMGRICCGIWQHA